MTKKHFVALAGRFFNLLDSLECPEARAGVILSIEAVIAVCEDSNSRFDSDRFRSACGLPD